MPQDKYLDINGLRLHYLDWGNNGHQPMLLLHGFTAHAHVWDDFALNFGSYYHVIALDQRGHGESQWSKEGSYSIEDHFVDLTNFVETLGLRKLILVGHSMGGRNALFYTACNSVNVERLVLIDARPGNNPESSEALRHLLLNLPLEEGSLDEVVRKVYALYPYLSREICYHMVSHGYKQMRNGKLVPKYDVRMSLHLERSEYAVGDLWPLMNNLSCSTLVIRGEESSFLSRQDAKKMCELIPKSGYREIPHATHMPAQENPDATKRAILDFLND
ncbi:MAG: alpha/beta hydrolase [Deltaproteobacteria bacterium]|nr:alpha/beta hydrolase [Deltaproteobacteria bacterium]